MKQGLPYTLCKKNGFCFMRSRFARSVSLRDSNFSSGNWATFSVVMQFNSIQVLTYLRIDLYFADDERYRDYFARLSGCRNNSGRQSDFATHVDFISIKSSTGWHSVLYARACNKPCSVALASVDFYSIRFSATLPRIKRLPGVCARVCICDYPAHRD